MDPESGEEYGWEDVITFDDNMRVNHKKLLIDAIRTSLIRESIFLFSKKYIINLNDIPQKGIWISCLTNNKSKSVFRLLIKTRTFGVHNLVVNLNEGKQINSWMKKQNAHYTSSGTINKPLVENFGGWQRI